MKLFHSPSYVAAAYAFDTTRKSAEIAKSLESRPISGLEVFEPRSLTFEEIVRVHDTAYVEAFRCGSPRELASSSGFPWDSGVWDAVTSSNGGLVDAALEELRTGGVAGSLSSGLPKRTVTAAEVSARSTDSSLRHSQPGMSERSVC